MKKGQSYIKHIYIKNFRSIGKDGVSIDCNSSNIFSGGNDSGKSNVLKALSLFFENTRYIPNRDFHEFSRDNNERGKRICEIRITFNGGKKLVRGIRIIDKINDPRVGVLNLMENGFIIQKQYFEAQNIETKITSLDGNEFNDKETFLSLFNANFRYYYLPAIKDRLEVSKIKNLMADILSDNIVFEEQQLSDELGAPYNDFEKYLKLKLSSNTSLNTFFQSLQFQINEGTIQKRGFGSQNVSIPLELRGDGVQMMNLILLLKFLVGHKLSKSNWILGIEEPEMAIEIAKQIQLSEILSIELSQFAQLFCTTHSPFIAFPKNSHNQNTFLVQKQRQNFGTIKFKLYTTITSVPLDEQRSLLELSGFDAGDTLHSEIFGKDDRAIQAGLYYAYQKYGSELKYKIDELKLEHERKDRELERISNQIGTTYPPKVLIIEDESKKSLVLWNYLLGLYNLSDVQIYSSKGIDSDIVEANLKMKIEERSSIGIPYSIKVFREVDRDGLSNDFTEKIETYKSAEWESIFQYKYRFLPVCEIENFAISDGDLSNITKLATAKERLENKINDKIVKYSNNGDIRTYLNSNGIDVNQDKHFSLTKKISKIADNDKQNAYPGKIIVGPKRAFSILLNLSKNDLPEKLKEFMSEIKEFFD